MKESLIIDTDPGIDDALAIILAYLTPSVDIKAITLTHGNVGMECVKKNAAVILHALLDNQKFLQLPLKPLPVLAVGASSPLEITPIEATYFHGEDGIGMIYNELHKAPQDWEKHFIHEEETIEEQSRWFETTTRDAADEILYQLEQAEPLTVTIAAIGPLTNIALAYQRNPVIFSRAKRIVVMGGAVDVPGNIGAYAEFNFRADPHAAKIVMGTSKGFQHSPEGYQQRLDLIAQGKVAPSHIVILPLDAADGGMITKVDYEKYVLPLGKSTPLFGFINAFMQWSFQVSAAYYKMDSWAIYDAYTMLLLIEMIQDKGDGKGDPTFDQRWKCKYLDLTIETSGEYTLGMCCVDRRDYQKDKKPWDGIANNVQTFFAGDASRFRTVMLNTIFGQKE
ncbi:Inosine/uridine-preferring nucleoside hydrolase domain-containing protein [Halteromyces radiatus]|uniref:Inosine/uridine-preferring nucleoside hydrolase domain-containing protein n=1 Tax=Halteromyces radiatus TaxID=101107 RepID=UPI00221F2F2D|nr:Inosine/uridine-preferring nucleoside hydrolase domain-containing protein [Halteromyces radiatus]KAI8086331.1 Inosine/uridine-preferring nucleoside hydrolase domain-containing protein [Halteromyces radiatus]